MEHDKQIGHTAKRMETSRAMSIITERGRELSCHLRLKLSITWNRFFDAVGKKHVFKCRERRGKVVVKQRRDHLACAYIQCSAPSGSQYVWVQQSWPTPDSSVYFGAPPTARIASIMSRD